MVICLALLAALANAIASICQRLGVEDAPASKGPSMGLVRHMLGRPVWILGFVIMAAGYVAQASALHAGTLNVVQPIMVSELVILVLVLWLWFLTPLRLRDLAAAVATAAGLAAFLYVASPNAGRITPSDARWLVTSLTVLALVGVFALVGSRGPAWRRALLLGAGASTGFALVAAITKSLTNVLLAGWGALFGSWQLYALCVIGLGSFLLMQSAFQVGPFAASQSTLILVNPFVSIAVGRVLYGETLRGGTFNVALEGLSLAVMIAGALGLATSSLVANVHEESGGSHLLAGRGHYARWRQRRRDA